MCVGGPMVRRFLLIASLFAVCLMGLVNGYAADKDDDTPKAAATRKLLKTKVTVNFKDTPLKDIIEEIQDQVQDKTKKKMGVRVDNKGGVSNNTKFTYKADDEPLDELLDKMFKKNDLGYV